MATVYFHIGAPKTATSSIQSVLARSYSRLLSEAVLYPKRMRSGDAHHLLICDLIEKYQRKPMPDIWYGSNPRGEAWNTLKAEIAEQSKPIDTVIISSELFFGQVNNMREALEEMADHLQGHEVKIVVYLRRQDQLYSSFYNQDVKGVRQWGASAYEFYETHQMLRHDYLSLLRPWGEVFGKDNIILRPFESGKWPDGDILKDFSEALGGLNLSKRGAIENNKGLGPTQLYLKRCLNRVGFDKAANEAVLIIVEKVIKEDPAGNCQFVNRGLYRRYLDQWEAVNRKLSKQFLNGEPMFSKPIPHPQDVELYDFDRFHLALAINNIVKLFSAGRYAEHRSLFMRATLLAVSEQNLWRALDKDSRQFMLDGI